jgi:hypothetical protein
VDSPGGDCAGLCRRKGSSPVEIVEACAGLRAWPGGDRECLWIASLAGLGGMAWQSGVCAGLCRPGGAAQWSRDCVCVDPRLCRIYISLIHLLVVEHLGCFQCLDIVNSAVVSTGVKCLYCILTYILLPGNFKFPLCIFSDPLIIQKCIVHLHMLKYFP